MKQRIRGAPLVPFRLNSGEKRSAIMTTDKQRSRSRSHSRRHSNVGLPSPLDRTSCLIEANKFFYNRVIFHFLWKLGSSPSYADKVDVNNLVVSHETFASRHVAIKRVGDGIAISYYREMFYNKLTRNKILSEFKWSYFTRKKRPIWNGNRVMLKTRIVDIGIDWTSYADRWQSEYWIKMLLCDAWTSVIDIIDPVANLSAW